MRRAASSALGVLSGMAGMADGDVPVDDCLTGSQCDRQAGYVLQYDLWRGHRVSVHRTVVSASLPLLTTVLDQYVCSEKP